MTGRTAPVLSDSTAVTTMHRSAPSPTEFVHKAMSGPTTWVPGGDRDRGVTDFGTVDPDPARVDGPGGSNWEGISP